MFATKRWINELRMKSFLNITKEQEKIILKKLGYAENKENPYEYTEQDLWEQTRQILKKVE